MSWRAFVLSAAVIVGLWTAGTVYVMQGTKPAPAPPLRLFVVYQGPEGYRVEAEEFRVEGFCSVFYKGGVRFATVCGQHTVSEAVEVQ